MAKSIPSCQGSVEFEPSCWGDYFINVAPLQNAIKLEMEKEVANLVKEVKRELSAKAYTPTKQLELIDAIERLEVAYHFDKEIEEILDNLYESYLNENEKYNLYHTSLGFRIFRQHGFNLSSDVFKKFKSTKGFYATTSNNLKGILSLYEACHVAIHADDILEEALEFTTTRLKAVGEQRDSPLADQVTHALQQPLQRGIILLESKQYISFYEQNHLHDKTLLRLAKLDFNLLLAMHQAEMKELAVWWKDVHARLPFARDRSVECYFWTLGVYYEPQYSLARQIFTRLFMVVQILDDIHDSYGTFQERQLLIEAIHGHGRRWDYKYVTQLPKYFNDCYKALLETFDKYEHQLAKEGKSYRFSYWKEQMKLNCQAWFDEAKWCQMKHIPIYDEYIEVSRVSVAQTAGLIATFLGMGDIVTKDCFEWVSQIPTPKIVKASEIILRLMNDIGGHKFEQNREHVASSVECYMKQHGISNEVRVYEELEEKVKDYWKDVNEGMLKPYAIPKALLDRCLNLTRVPDVLYKGRTEGYTFVNQTIQQKIASVLVHPIPL